MHHPNHADHTRHDVTLIAGLAAGDLSDSERNRAETLLATCSPCADLHRDVLAIAAATKSLPAPVMATRDFRLTPAQADRLQRGSWLRAALRPFGSARSATRPMAAAFTSLGIAGLLVATVLPGLFGSAASPSFGQEGAAAGAPNATAAPVGGALGAADAPTPDVREGNVDNGASADPDQASPGTKVDSAATNPPAVVVVGADDTGNDGNQVTSERISATSPPNLLLLGSFGLLAAGLVLFGLRFAGRRLR